MSVGAMILNFTGILGGVYVYPMVTAGSDTRQHYPSSRSKVNGQGQIWPLLHSSFEQLMESKSVVVSQKQLEMRNYSTLEGIRCLT